eukprot:TRINITY_DN14062_c0_g2_i1.p1 TRINITY_DN14062_c0_g2~~TRINITY_DN14062_c0_g2_i1.p1  ORF type:complete len:890 (-),score=172.68 TRINITY_DN14062_c0_g2_i1:114-2783(-)
MPANGSSQACGFSVHASKKGELPFRTEKRARGKKVTIIANVSGDATKLVRALQSMLGVGGTVRQAERGSWTVEVQGDQVARVTKALLDFGCLAGLSKAALDAAKKSQQSGEKEATSFVTRNAATKFLAQTQDGAKLSPAEERRRALEVEAEFYGKFWQLAAVPSDDFDDLWDTGPEVMGEMKGPEVAMSLPELNLQLRSLGMFAECGSAVKEFWESKPGLTVAQFRKMALNPGARLIGSTLVKNKAPSNLISRQKISDWKSGGSGKYFSAPCTAVDEYHKYGRVLTAAEREEKKGPTYQAKSCKLEVSSDAEGWCQAAISFVVPLEPPSSRADAEQQTLICKRALRELQDTLGAKLKSVRESIPGVECSLDCDNFGLDISLHEREFLHMAKPDTGKVLDNNMKEELRLGKKLREISVLKKRQLDGDNLDKLQVEKVNKRTDLFKELADMKLRRAEKRAVKLFKDYASEFKDAFWNVEMRLEQGEADDSAQPDFGVFDESSCEGDCIVGMGGTYFESRGQLWAGSRLRLAIQDGEVGAFVLEVMEGLLRVGFAGQSSHVAELGSDSNSFGFGGTGKKVRNGAFESYGETFGVGDVLHCEAEREDGRLRIGFAKNDEALGIAFEVEDTFGDEAVFGVVCGKGLKCRLLSAEKLPLSEAPGLDNFVEFDPPRLAVATCDYRDAGEDCLKMWAGETVNIASDDGEGWLFGYFLDPEDPDDGGWLPVDCVRYLDEEYDGEVEADAESTAAWNAPAPTSDWDVSAPEADEPAPISDWDTSAPEADDPWGAPAPAAIAAWEEDDGAEIAPEKLETPPSDPALVQATSPSAEISEDDVAAFLQGASLLKHLAPAMSWCTEMGAVSVDEILENWEDFADDLKLKPLERKRLEKAVQAA